MDLAADVAALRLRVDELERVKRNLVARLELLDSAVTVTRHGREQVMAENVRLRRALVAVDVGLSPMLVVLAQLDVQGGGEDHKMLYSAIKLALDLVDSALRDPIGVGGE